jgi:hypothetical protein
VDEFTLLLLRPDRLIRSVGRSRCPQSTRSRRYVIEQGGPLMTGSETRPNSRGKEIEIPVNPSNIPEAVIAVECNIDVEPCRVS